ncbi:polysaccharide biosynthesis protein [Maritalea myrionectae]|uniref:polysaccharide biosynthesis protein n=1 Tax=Maritalea myrionectae TaxID=454601 RepID=UPI0003F9E434|nr:nucleoside-diphosphate sugar epimerase/dehydratase [Maritalea myrionectae]
MINKFLTFLFGLNRWAKRSIQVAVDVFLITFSYLLAMMLRLDGIWFAAYADRWTILLLIIPASIFLFARIGLYRAVIRYIGGQALLTIGTGILVSAAMMLLFSQLLNLPVPRSVPAIYAFIAFFLIGGVRFLLRALYFQQRAKLNDNVLIYGAGESGRQLLNALKQGAEFQPVAFIDDAKEFRGVEVAGIPVFGPDKIGSLIEKYGIKAILLALPSAPVSARKAIITRLEPFEVQVRTIPGMRDLVSGKAEIADLQTVKPEDLLGRDPVPPNQDLLSANIKDKTVLVSGAGGSIGSELCRQILSQCPKQLVLLEVSEYALYRIHDELEANDRNCNVEILPVLGSVQNEKRIKAILERFKVDTIYHAAAYKHVPLVEQNVVEGIRNNIFGTDTIVRAALAARVSSFILISTDKAVRPTNIMGATKRVTELICQAHASQSNRTRFSMVRFGNVLGSSGSVIPRFQRQIDSGGPVTVTHPEINRFFMTIPEAAQLVIQAGAMAKGGEVFVLDMGEPVKIVDLAQRMIRLQGLKPYIADGNNAVKKDGDIEIVFTGLRIGEKLYEELLIGENPTPTSHERIMCAQERSLPSAELEQFLKDLFDACAAYDLPKIRTLLQNANTGYQPQDEIGDVIWLQSGDA